MHLHGRQFQILSRSIAAGGVNAYNTVKDGLVDDGWHDTFLIMPYETVELQIPRAMESSPWTIYVSLPQSSTRGHGHDA